MLFLGSCLSSRTWHLPAELVAAVEHGFWKCCLFCCTSAAGLQVLALDTSAAVINFPVAQHAAISQRLGLQQFQPAPLKHPNAQSHTVYLGGIHRVAVRPAMCVCGLVAHFAPLIRCVLASDAADCSRFSMVIPLVRRSRLTVWRPLLSSSRCTLPTLGARCLGGRGVLPAWAHGQEGIEGQAVAHDAARFCRGFLVRARTPTIRSCSA